MEKVAVYFGFLRMHRGDGNEQTIEIHTFLYG